MLFFQDQNVHPNVIAATFLMRPSRCAGSATNDMKESVTFTYGAIPFAVIIVNVTPAAAPYRGAVSNSKSLPSQ